MPQLSMQSPVGALTVSAEDDEIVALDWGWGRDQEASPLLREAVAQLNDYFDGVRRCFDLPLQPSATAFGTALRSAILAIPYGTTLRPAEIAARIGTSSAAVGRAGRTNPLPLLVPYHRLAGARRSADPDLADEAGIARTLLALEREFSSQEPSSSEAQP